MNGIVNPSTPNVGDKCRVYIGRQWNNGRMYSSGWRVAVVLAIHNDVYRDSMDVQTRDGNVWRRCDLQCVKAH